MNEILFKSLNNVDSIFIIIGGVAVGLGICYGVYRYYMSSDVINQEKFNISEDKSNLFKKRVRFSKDDEVQTDLLETIENGVQADSIIVKDKCIQVDEINVKEYSVQNVSTNLMEAGVQTDILENNPETKNIGIMIQNCCRGLVDPNNISNTTVLTIKNSFLNSVNNGIINMSNDGIYKFKVFGFKLIVINNNNIIRLELVDSVDQYKYIFNKDCLLLINEWKIIM